MSPAFSSWAAFFAMGGYAFYVWLAVAATLLPLAALIIHTLWRRRALLSEIRRQQARLLRIRQGSSVSRPQITPASNSGDIQ